MKIFKKAHIQRALVEEAQGNYKQAAAFYSKAEEFEKVGEMYELIGDMERLFPRKIKAYQQAVRWYQQPKHLEPLAAKLAHTMETEIRADRTVSAAEQYRLPKVAEYYAQAKQWGEAGRIYEELGQYDEATQMYIQAGDVERVEQIAARKGRHNHRAYTAQNYYEDALAACQVGRRDKAWRDLQQCLTLDAEHQEANTFLTALKEELHPRAVQRVRAPLEECEFVLVAKPVVTIGRKEDNDIPLAETDISRYHARFGFHRQRVLVEDLQSSNGTRVNGLRIQKTAVLHDRDLLGFGLHTQFEVRLHQHETGLAAILCPREARHFPQRYIVFTGEILMGADYDTCAVHLRHLSLPYLFKIKYQQPYWYVYLHPNVTDAEFNGTPVSEYVVVASGDQMTFAEETLLFD